MFLSAWIYMALRISSEWVKPTEVGCCIYLMKLVMEIMHCIFIILSLFPVVTLTHCVCHYKYLLVSFWINLRDDESERGEWKNWLKDQHSENEDHGIWSHHLRGNRWGNSGNSGWLYFFWGGAPKSLQLVIAAMKLKDAYFLEGKLWPT